MKKKNKIEIDFLPILGLAIGYEERTIYLVLPFIAFTYEFKKKKNHETVK